MEGINHKPLHIKGAVCLRRSYNASVFLCCLQILALFQGPTRLSLHTLSFKDHKHVHTEREGLGMRPTDNVGVSRVSVPRHHPLNGKGSSDIARFSWLC